MNTALTVLQAWPSHWDSEDAVALVAQTIVLNSGEGRIFKVLPHQLCLCLQTVHAVELPVYIYICNVIRTCLDCYTFSIYMIYIEYPFGTVQVCKSNVWAPFTIATLPRLDNLVCSILPPQLPNTPNGCVPKYRHLKWWMSSVFYCQISCQVQVCQNVVCCKIYFQILFSNKQKSPNDQIVQSKIGGQSNAVITCKWVNALKKEEVILEPGFGNW